MDFATATAGVLNILRRRYLVLLTISVVVFAMFVVLLTLMTPRYQAMARVRIDPKPVAGSGTTVDQTQGMPDQSVVDTETAVIKSRDVAVAVVNNLKLTENAELTEGLNDKDKPVSPAERTEIVVARVLNNLKVEREASTYLVDITFKSKSASTAAAVANGFANSYIHFTVSRRTGTAEQQYAWLDKRLSTLSSEARSADASLAQYQASNGITTGTGEATITDQQVAPLSMQLAQAQADAASARSDLNVAQSQMATGGATAASSVLNSPAIAALRQSRATTEQQLSQLATRYGPKHPQTVQMQQQLSAIDAQISEEAHRIVGELRAKSSAADARTGSLSGQLSHLRGEQASNARLSVSADALKRDADAKHGAYNQLAGVAQQVDQLSQNSLSQAQIIESAVPPMAPSSPNSRLILTAGLLVGLTLGLGTIVLQELLSRGFLRVEDVEQALGAKVLASVPMLKAKTGNPADELIDKPLSVFAEAFRSVRNSLLLAGDESPRVIAMVSTVPNEGKTTSALSLARILAMSGERVIIIDGDVRLSGLTLHLAKAPTVGLIEVLRNNADYTQAILPDMVPGLDILGNAPHGSDISDLFVGDTFTRLIDLLRTRYDRIVIDTPPILGVAEARPIAVAADAVVMVVKWNDTARNGVKTAVKWLRLDNAQLAGVLLTMVSPKAEAFGALYYSRAYAKYYQQD